MDIKEFNSIEVNPNCHLCMKWGNQILFEADGFIVDKAEDTSGYRDLRIAGKDDKGNEFVGWFPLEQVELINNNTENAEVIKLKHDIKLLEDGIKKGINFLSSYVEVDKNG